MDRAIEEIDRSKFNPMNVEMKPYMMILRHKRLVRHAKEARALEIQAKNVAFGKKVKDPAATKAVKGREASYYRHARRTHKKLLNSIFPSTSEEGGCLCTSIRL
ncbi:hypothetical protein H5410_036201 [Solanum commersonii]|uniref:Uncharacterized protein n=1 Tax=Solanum commersonii TaxID=4109 RepID=A0A9J5Y3I2_SOLCO|nr:hypothetical protein H5410_036201 [Solanum commersonii]